MDKETRNSGILIIVVTLSSVLLCSCTRFPSPTTNTPTLQSVPQATATALPTVTSTPLPSPTRDPLAGMPALVLEAIIDDQSTLIILDSGLTPISSFRTKFILLHLAQNGCHLTAFGQAGDVSGLLTLNYQGEVIDSKTYKAGSYDLGIGVQSLESPDGKWVASKETRGDYGRSPWDGKIQDVYVSKVENLPNQQPVKVTRHSGAGQVDLIWSPDSRYLTFVDFDDAGMRQIYVYEPASGIKTQVTKFSEEYIISTIKWSLEGKAIAFDQYPVNEGDGGRVYSGIMGLISLPGFTYQEIRLNFPHLSGTSIWWGSRGELLIYANSADKNTDAIFWYNYTDNVVERRITLFPGLSNSRYYDAIPLTDDLSRIALLGRPNAIYYVDTGTIEAAEDPMLAAALRSYSRYVVTSPSGALRNDACLREWTESED